jgi:hypothetical protein
MYDEVLSTLTLYTIHLEVIQVIFTLFLHHVLRNASLISLQLLMYNSDYSGRNSFHSRIRRRWGWDWFARNLRCYACNRPFVQRADLLVCPLLCRLVCGRTLGAGHWFK